MSVKRFKLKSLTNDEIEKLALTLSGKTVIVEDVDDAVFFGKVLSIERDANGDYEVNFKSAVKLVPNYDGDFIFLHGETSYKENIPTEFTYVSFVSSIIALT